MNQNTDEAKEPKRLYRSRSNKMIGGVCGGLAEYFEIDATILRVIFVLLAFAKGIGIFLYLIALIIVPTNVEDKPNQTKSRTGGTTASIVIGIILILIGLHFLAESVGPFYFWPHYWFIHWPWEVDWDLLWPVLLILVGVLYIVHTSRSGKKIEQMKEKPTAELRAEQRKLLRSRRNRKIAGVCGGLGEYFNIDPTWVRLGWIFLSLLSSIILGLVVYIILVIVLPEEK